MNCWYILVEFSDGTRAYQRVDTSGDVVAIVDLEGRTIDVLPALETRVIDATPPRPAWAGDEPPSSSNEWMPQDV